MCKVRGCSRAVVGYGGSLCAGHRWRARRNGHPEQITIKASDVAPFLHQLDRRRLTYPEAPAWSILRARWSALADTARGMIRAFNGGMPMVCARRMAAVEIVRVADEATPEDAWREAVALHMLKEDRPALFVSDRAYLVQLSLRVRKLAASNRAAFGDPSRGPRKRALRDPNADAAAVMGAMLRDTFEVAGAYFDQQERVEEERRTAERKAFHEAMREVAPEGAVW